MAAPSCSSRSNMAAKLASSRPPTALLSASSLRFPSPLRPLLPRSISIYAPRSQSHRPTFGPVSRQGKMSKLFSVVDVNQVATAREEEAEVRTPEGGELGKQAAGVRSTGRSFELYVCNLPRSCDISDLLDIFSPYGTVQSVEVSRNPQTGDSRGCGYVTMSSVLEAKEAMTALDGSDLSGREMRIRFSTDMAPARKNSASLNTETRKVLFYEGRHKVYVGNLSWFMQPEDIREYFSQFGTVVSVKLFRDKGSGKRRVYGFLSFSNAEEVKAAVLSSGTAFQGRPLLVRKVIEREWK